MYIVCKRTEFVIFDKKNYTTTDYTINNNEVLWLCSVEMQNAVFFVIT